MKAILVKEGYNYPAKLQKALENNDQSAIKSLLKRKKAIYIDWNPKSDDWIQTL